MATHTSRFHKGLKRKTPEYFEAAGIYMKLSETSWRPSER